MCRCLGLGPENARLATAWSCTRQYRESLACLQPHGTFYAALSLNYVMTVQAYFVVFAWP
jgi:hypothetical protein